MTKRIDRSAMTRKEANVILNCVREGDDIPEYVIVRALQVLGDCGLPEYPVVQQTERGMWEGRLGGRPASWLAVIE